LWKSLKDNHHKLMQKYSILNNDNSV